MVSYKVNLPTFEELEFPDIPFGGHVLRAGGPQLGKYCEQQNDDFMICRKELGIQHCINEGKEVTKCTLDFFVKMKKMCYHELDAYSTCLDKGSINYDLTLCRKTQAAFDKCVLDNLNVARPDIFYWTRPRVYKGERPAPPPPLPQIFDDIPTELDYKSKDFPEPMRAPFNSRFFWFT